MSQDVFQSLTGGKTTLAECDRSVYTYTHLKSLELKEVPC